MSVIFDLMRLEPRLLLSGTFDFKLAPTDSTKHLTVTDLVVSPKGDNFVCGWYDGAFDADPGAAEALQAAPTNSAAFVARYSNGGALKWIRVIDSANNDSNFAIALESDGKVVVIGHESSATISSDKFVLSRYTAKGKRTLNLKSQSGFDGIVQGLATDADGNLFLGGYVNGHLKYKTVDINNPDPQTSTAGFLMSLDHDGNVNWLMKPKGNVTVNSLATDAAGKVYLTGAFSGVLDLTPGKKGGKIKSPATQNIDAFAAKLKNGGGFIWGERVGSDDQRTGDRTVANGIAVDSDGNVGIVGNFVGLFEAGDVSVLADASADIYATKFNKNGKIVFARTFGAATSTVSNDGSTGDDIAFDSKGNMLICGDFEGKIDFDPSAKKEILDGKTGQGLLLKLDTAGDLLAVKAIKGGAGSAAIVYSVDTDEDDFIIFTGATATSGIVTKWNKNLKA